MKRLTGICFVCMLCVVFAGVAGNAGEPGELPGKSAGQKDKKGTTKPAGKKKSKDKSKQQPKTPPQYPQDLAANPFSQPPELSFDLSQLSLRGAPEMLGDLAPQPVFVPFQGNPFVIPGTRSFKVSDNGSPRPQDRVYYSFNYFNDVFGSTNQRLSGIVREIDFSRHVIGVEKTLLDGRASVEARVPVNTVSARTAIAGLNGTNTAMGDVSVVLRYALWADPCCDNWLTAGVAVTAPTGPDGIGGINGTFTLPGPCFAVTNPVTGQTTVSCLPGQTTNQAFSHSAALQPFVAVLRNHGNWYWQAFSALDIPTGGDDTTLWFNDIAVGCYLYRSPGRQALLTAVIPTFEAHVTTPLNNRGPIGPNNPLGGTDIVNLTFGTTFDFRSRSSLAVGVVTPVTGPRPFEVEGTMQFRLRY